MYLANKFEKLGLKTVYPGLTSHPSHLVFKNQMNTEFGYGGMLTIDVGSLKSKLADGAYAKEKFEAI